MNVYPGWYGTEKLSEIPEKLDNFAKFVTNKPKVISEIGAAAICGDHSGAPWSEDYQAEYIKTVVTSINNNPEWSGIMLWLFCNCNTYIGTDYMPMRPRGFNNKGLLDEYRRPKMAWKTLKDLLK
jgi:beta-glucuronidase